MHRPYGLQGSLKRRYKHPSPTSINGYHTAKKLLSQSPAKRPTFAFTHESGYTHSALLKGSHTAAHTAKHGVFWVRVVSLPSARSARSRTSPGRVSERQTLPLWGLGREVLSKNAESLRDSDALMRVAVPRRRGPAGLRDLFSFLSKFMALRPALRAFYACEVGVVSLPPARAAYCRRSRRPLVKAAYLPFSEVGWAPLPVRYFF